MISKIIISLTLVACLLALTSCSTPVPTVPSPTLVPRTRVAGGLAQPINATVTPAAVPTTIPLNHATVEQIKRDITYCTTQGVALKLDLYRPPSAKSNGKPLPVAVNIHGGSWRGGDKAESDSGTDIATFVERGYAVAAVNYRLAPEYKFPAQIEDVKCAIRFLRANAKTYNLDPNRIGAWGCSAGGHLAALLGVADSTAGFDQGEYLQESSHIQTVATLSAPMDLNLYDTTARAKMLTQVFGTNTDKTILAKDSPITYVSKKSPPFLIFQGNQDSLISPKHGENLVGRLTAEGATARLITVQNGTHCFPPTPAMKPSRDEISTQVVDFFDKELRK